MYLFVVISYSIKSGKILPGFEINNISYDKPEFLNCFVYFHQLNGFTNFVYIVLSHIRYVNLFLYSDEIWFTYNRANL